MLEINDPEEGSQQVDNGRLFSGGPVAGLLTRRRATPRLLLQ